MKNIILLGAFLVLMLAVSACTSSAPSGPTAKDTFIGGNKGLSLSFVQNSPPAEVNDGGKFPFQMIVNVENVGEYTIPAELAHLRVAGFFAGEFLPADKVTEKSTAKIINPCPATGECPADARMEGVRKVQDNKIRGEVVQVAFPADNEFFNYQSALRGNLQIPFIRAEACYRYKTTAVSQFCVLSDYLKEEGAVCAPRGTLDVANSGAPVQVTVAKQDVASKRRTIFEFTVKRTGTSEIFRSTTGKPATECVDRNNNKDRVFVSVFTGSGFDEKLTCQGLLRNTENTDRNTGELILTNGEGTFTCFQDIPAGSGDGLKSFNMEIDYYAKDIVDTPPLLVRHFADE